MRRIGRREFMEWSALSGGAFLLTSSGLVVPRARAIESPRLTPFVDELPIPPTVQNADPFDAPDCADYLTPTTRYYEMVIEEAEHRFHRDLGPATIWRYRDKNGTPRDLAVGPTFDDRMSTADRPGIEGGVVARFENDLPKVGDHVGFGVPRMTVHHHGGHQPADSDGFPANIADANRSNVIEPGKSRDYCFPLLDVGWLDGPIEKGERNSTNWYHDHLLDHTAENIYRGLSGFSRIFDELDSGDEEDPDPLALRLPSREFDIPLVLQDRLFARNGSLIYDPFDHNGFLGDRFVVNGKVQPFLVVKPRKYRFRLLNGSNARHYQLFLTQGSTRRRFDVIATSGGLLSRTVRDRQSIILAPAQRKEIVIDFSAFRNGDVLYLENRLRQDDGRGPKGDLAQPDLSVRDRLLKFIVDDGGSAVDDPSRVPDRLRPFAPISNAELNAAVVREFEFDRSGGVWVINDREVDLDRALVVSPANRPEIRRLKNGGGGWWHPIHIHLEDGRIIRRDGRRPRDPLEQDGIAKEDTFILDGGAEVDVFYRFRDYPGPYVFHCHNAEHEDMFMMARFDVV